MGRLPQSHVAVGHEHMPDYDLYTDKTCPVCGESFTYVGGWGHGGTPVCSYHCQRVLEDQYKASREYAEIQAQLAGKGFTKADVETTVRDDPEDGPLTEEQLAWLMDRHPRVERKALQKIAFLLSRGETYYTARMIVHTNTRIVADVSRFIVSPPAAGRRKKLSHQQCREIVYKWREGWTVARLSEWYQVSDHTIRRAIKETSGAEIEGL